MLRNWTHLKRWSTYQSPIFWLFLVGFTSGIFLLTTSLTLNKPSLSTTDKVALFVGLLAGAMVWWQGQLIARQMVLSAVIDLYRDWNSQDMIEKRKAAWANEGPNPNSIEDVLEFLEKVSTLAKNRFVTHQLVWDTFGWYIGRYYFYSKNVIQDLRRKWSIRVDPTLYQDLEELYFLLLDLEAEQRNEKRDPGTELLTTKDIETEYNRTRRMFISSEIGEVAQHG
jgi:hypothetical protein